MPVSCVILLLAGAAGAYALGFIIWSIHAFVNDLGLLPAINAQYIVAGLTPIILVCLAVASLYVVTKGIDLKMNFDEDRISLVLGTLFTLFLLGIFFLPIPTMWRVVTLSMSFYIYLILRFAMYGVPSTLASVRFRILSLLRRQNTPTWVRFGVLIPN